MLEICLLQVPALGVLHSCLFPDERFALEGGWEFWLPTWVVRDCLEVTELCMNRSENQDHQGTQTARIVAVE